MEGPICYIVGAGTFYEEGFAPELGDFVIAADGGYQILLERGVTMDLVVGDFDSIGFRPDHPNVVDLPVEKDDTDMMAAIRLGRERGFRLLLPLWRDRRAGGPYAGKSPIPSLAVSKGLSGRPHRRWVDCQGGHQWDVELRSRASGTPLGILHGGQSGGGLAAGAQISAGGRGAYL